VRRLLGFTDSMEPQGQGILTPSGTDRWALCNGS
jgi:hypothetical protein